MAERTGVLKAAEFSKIADSVDVLLRVVDDQLEIAYRQEKSSPWMASRVPAYALAEKSASTNPVWGAHAQAWSLRGRAAKALFPLGYPSEPKRVREFLRYAVVDRLSLARSPRVAVGVNCASELEREVWQEVFDEGGWQLWGFLAEPVYLRTLHREVHQRTLGSGPLTKTLVLELRLSELRWLALAGDEVEAEGGEPALGSRVLVRDFQHHLRHVHSLEVSELVALAFLFPENHRAGTQVAGRQVHSGLPTRMEVDLDKYWLLGSKAGERWVELRSRIARRILGWATGDPWSLLPDHGWNLAIDKTLPRGFWEQKMDECGLVR